jgi:ATP synthase protein I
VTEVAPSSFGQVRDLPYADGVPAASDGPSPSGPMPAVQATSVALRASVILTSLAGVAATLLAAVLSGTNAAVGAALGAVIAVVFFAAGQYAVTRLLNSHADMAFTGALLVYVVQILVLFVLIALLKGQEWLDVRWFASTIVVCTFVWIGAQLWTVNRIKTLIVEPAPTSSDEAEVEQ